jgi:hypothetical protein
MRSLLIAFLLIFCAAASARAADGIYICAEHTDRDDWIDEFSRVPLSCLPGLFSIMLVM